MNFIKYYFEWVFLGLFLVVKEDFMNNKDVIEIDNGYYVENNLLDVVFSDEEDDMGMSRCYFLIRIFIINDLGL